MNLCVLSFIYASCFSNNDMNKSRNNKHGDNRGDSDILDWEKRESVKEPKLSHVKSSIMLYSVTFCWGNQSKHGQAQYLFTNTDMFGPKATHRTLLKLNSWLIDWSGLIELRKFLFQSQKLPLRSCEETSVLFIGPNAEPLSFPSTRAKIMLIFNSGEPSPVDDLTFLQQRHFKSLRRVETDSKHDRLGLNTF